MAIEKLKINYLAQK